MPPTPPPHQHPSHTTLAMDFNLVPLLQTLVAILVTFTWVSRMMKRTKSVGSKYPPAPEIPGARPILGHLHLLKYPMRIHRHFAALAQKYGPLYIIRPALFRTLVVSNYELAKECFTSQDLGFADRPYSYVHTVMGYNRAMFTFAHYGSYWREARKITTTRLLSAHKVEQMRHARAAEVGEAMKSFYGLWVENGRRPVSIKMNGRIEDLVFNIIMRAVTGRRYAGEEVKEEEALAATAFRKAAKEFNRFLVVTVRYDAFPLLGWLDLKGDIKAMKTTHELMDSIIQGWVDEQRQKRKMGLYDNSGNKDDESLNLMDALLDMEEDGRLAALPTDVDTFIKATAMNLIIAGVESTSITFTWIFSLLLKNPSVLEKARAEVDAAVGKERNLDESDVANLPYVQAIVKETLRLYPPAPLLIPHGSRDDCIVGGYHVSRGTRLIVNVWMIQRDPRLWSDPEKFYPERFITNNVDIKGQNFEIIPFGSGRRICPGASFALQLLQFTVARMVHAFDLSIDPVVGLDLEEGYENFLTKLNPLWIQLKPRLPEKFYASV